MVILIYIIGVIRGAIMGNSDEGKNQKSSLWTTTIDKEPLPTNQDIKKAIQNI